MFLQSIQRHCNKNLTQIARNRLKQIKVQHNENDYICSMFGGLLTTKNQQWEIQPNPSELQQLRDTMKYIQRINDEINNIKSKFGILYNKLYPCTQKFVSLHSAKLKVLLIH